MDGSYVASLEGQTGLPINNGVVRPGFPVVEMEFDLSIAALAKRYEALQGTVTMVVRREKPRSLRQDA